MLALLAVSLISFPLMRWYGGRVERSEGEVVEKVHRIRRALLVVSLFLWLVAIVLVLVELPLDRALFGDSLLVVGLLAVPVLVIGSAVAAYRGVRPAYERLRGIEGRTHGGSRRLVRLLVVLLSVQLAWPAFVVLVAIRKDWPAGFILLGLLVFLVLVGVSTPLIIKTGMSTREPTAADRERLQRMVDSHDVKIRGIRVVDTMHDPTATAVFTGFGPGPKYIFVTDKLLETFDDDELAAVIAHEIGHRKKHHILIKIATPIALLLVLTVVLALLIASDVPPAPVIVALPIAIIAGMILVQGTVGIALETQADDYASATLGPMRLRAALEKLAEFNMLKRRTGWLWNVLTQHPGLDRRIKRLEAHTAQETRSRPPQPRPRRVAVAAALTVILATAVVGMAVTLLWQMLTGTGNLGEQDLNPAAMFGVSVFALMLVAFSAVLMTGARQIYLGRGRGLLVVPLLVFVAIGSVGEVHDVMGNSSTRSNLIGATILVLAATPVVIVYTHASRKWFSRLQ